MRGVTIHDIIIVKHLLCIFIIRTSFMSNGINMINRIFGNQILMHRIIFLLSSQKGGKTGLA